MVNIVGIGPGNKKYILLDALDILEKSDMLIGFSRVIDSLDFIKTKKKKVNKLEDVIDILNRKGNNSNISIVSSGDPTFFGILNYIKNNYKGMINIIPGISSFQYLTSKIQKSWNNAYVGSLHGRDGNFIGNVINNNISIWLTDKRNSPSKLCCILNEKKIECNVIIGENLSYENEKIHIGKANNFMDKEFDELSIIIIERLV